VVEPPVTQPPAEEDDDGGTGWLPWVLAFAVLAVGGMALLARRLKPTAVPTPPWPDRAGRLVEDADLQSVQIAALTPEGLRVAAPVHAARLAEQTVALEELLASAPDPESEQALGQLQGPLSQLYAAIDAVALMPAGPTPEASEWVRSSAAGLHSVVTTTRLRLRIAPPTPDPGP
jgi:hypothetical protein